MKKILCLISIISIFSVLLFLHHEQSLALEKKENIDIINSKLSTTYTSFGNHLSIIHEDLVGMQDFFQSDPSIIPEIYNRYYLILEKLANEIIYLEKDGLKLQEFCNDLDNYSNKICFVYIDEALEVKDNYQLAIKKFNDVIIRYNDMSLSDYEVFR